MVTPRDVRFTILSHAGLWVQTADCSIVADPWLIGSCYWRSWWNYPPPPAGIIDGLAPDYIYITHLHWDHFHSPSLRRFDTKTPILVPRAHFDRMVRDLNFLGFHDVRELTHGMHYRLAGPTVVTSYQFGLALDSALVVDDGETTLLDANDCKLMGSALRQVRRRHPNIDFVLRSHSSAGPYPFCVSSEFPDHLTHRSNDEYAEEFLAFAEALEARYAIPFASNHCFLHRETRQFNATAVSPYEVKAYFDAHRKRDTVCQVMIPGDSWSSDGGFSLREHDYFTNRQSHLEELERHYQEKLERFYEREDKVRPQWSSFERYFSKLLDSLPLGFGWFFPMRVLFHVRGTPEADWLLDFRQRKLFATVDPSAPWDVRLEVHASVLRDCCQKNMFSTFTASKRVHYHLRTRRALSYFFVLNAVLDMYESDYFPLRLMLRRRFLANWLRRWREVLFYTGVASTLAFGRRPVRPADYLH